MQAMIELSVKRSVLTPFLRRGEGGQIASGSAIDHGVAIADRRTDRTTQASLAKAAGAHVDLN